MKRFSEYKASGVKWIGDIPADWVIRKIKHNTYVKGRIGWQGLKTDEYLSEGYAYLITGTDFSDGVINWNSCFYVDKARYDEDPHIQLKEGDLLITKDGTIGKISLVVDMGKPSTLNSGIFLVRPLNSNYSTSFLYWILCSPVFTGFFDYHKSGSTISHLYQNVFVEFGFPVPPINIQSQIVKFLDGKTRQINDLIAKKQKLIELLKEERTALINHAVTKGLDPTVSMKDSGIEWLGEIPKHWKVNKLKFNAKILNGSTPDSGNPEFWDGNIKWVTPSDISKINTIEISDSLRKITELGFANCGTNLIPANSIILTTRAPIGNLAINSVELCTNQGCKAIIPISGNSYYYYYQMLTFSDILISFGSGTTFKELSTPALSDFMVAIPPISEQSEIVSFLNRKNNEINDTIKSEEQQIEYLKEYKTTLINEAVTGKIDVRL